MAIKFSKHPHHALANYQENVPQGIFRVCPQCKTKFYFRKLGKYRLCPNCGYGFRVTARTRLKMLTKEFSEWDETIATTDPLAFPQYQAKIKQMQTKTKLKDAVLTGQAKIGDYETALGIMDPDFIMGSLGSATGERITKMFERATAEKLPVIMLTASGGARMQEGITSLMQMAKISQAVNQHREAGLVYIVVMMDPTTGGVTASFASQGDVILAEPHALVGFAGRRVIEQTINKKLPPNFQSAENAFANGFIDAIVPRTEQKECLEQLLAIFAAKKWEGAS